MTQDFFFSRRLFLTRGVQLLSVASTLPLFLDRSARVLAAQFADNPQGAGRNDRILVVVQLAGGNDGLNTIIPVSDDEYYKARPTLGIAAKKALKLNDDFYANPEMVGFKSLYDQGLLAIVHATGYPNHNRSHFRSMDIWQSAEPEGVKKQGWLGGYFDACCCGQDPAGGAPDSRGIDPSAAVALANDAPRTLIGQRFIPMVFRSPESLTRVDAASDDRSKSTFEKLNGGDEMDALLNDPEHRPLSNPASKETSEFLQRSALNARVYAERIRKSATSEANKEKYPQSKLGEDLKLVAQMIASGLQTRVYYVSISGFDTHSNQALNHPRLLKELADAVHSFMMDLKAMGHLQRTTLMTFSEFGRRVKENGGGTDHGEAAPMFVIGGTVKPGFHGTMPSLEPKKLSRGDVPYTTDFRRVYAGILRDWLGADDVKILGKKFEKLELFG